MKISRRTVIALITSVLIVTSIATASGLWTNHSSRAYAASTIPSQYFAPYAELGEGSSLQSVAQTTGQKFFTLAFMLGNGCQAEWDGSIPLSQANSAFP